MKFSTFSIGKHWGVWKMTTAVTALKEISINHGDNFFTQETIENNFGH